MTLLPSVTKGLQVASPTERMGDNWSTDLDSLTKALLLVIIWQMHEMVVVMHHSCYLSPYLPLFMRLNIKHIPSPLLSLHSSGKSL